MYLADFAHWFTAAVVIDLFIVFTDVVVRAGLFFVT
jgi:hypothetical protein